MKGCSELRNLDNFALISHRIFANWPTEFSKIFRGKCGP